MQLILRTTYNESANSKAHGSAALSFTKVPLQIQTSSDMDSNNDPKLEENNKSRTYS